MVGARPTFTTRAGRWARATAARRARSTAGRRPPHSAGISRARVPQRPATPAPPPPLTAGGLPKSRTPFALASLTSLLVLGRISGNATDCSRGNLMMNKMNRTALACVATWQVAAGTAAAQGAPPPAAQDITRAGAQASSVGRRTSSRAGCASIRLAGRRAHERLGRPGDLRAWCPLGLAHASRRSGLVVIAGVGLTQEWGKPVQVIRPGDVVLVPARHQALARRDRPPP
jgi:hypothetical protein